MSREDPPLVARRAVTSVGVLLTLLTLSTVGRGAAEPEGAGTSRSAAAEPNVQTLTVPSAVFRNSRTVRVYLPPGYEATSGQGRRYPVLFLNDGFAVFSQRAWDAPSLLDRMIREGRVEPMILVGIDNAATIVGSQSPALDRAREYLPWADPEYDPEARAPRGRDYPRFLYEEVVPAVERAFRTDPAKIGLGGSSYGAIAALYSAVEAPRPIERLLLESPPLFMFDERLTREPFVSRCPPWVYLGIGGKETDDPTLLAKGEAAIERFVEAARRSGATVALHKVDGATHGSAAWRARFPDAITALYGSGSVHTGASASASGRSMSSGGRRIP